MNTVVFVGLGALMAVLIGWSAMTFIFGAGIRTTEKTTFDGVGAASDQRYFIEFKDVWLLRLKFGNGYVKENVWVEPEKPGMNMIVVKIDSELSGTVISVVPTFPSRIMSMVISYKAKEVTIWVSTDDEVYLWEKWVKDAEEAYFTQQEQKRAQTPPRRIIPGAH